MMNSIKAKVPKAGIYIRVSTKKQAEKGLSLEAQADAIERFISYKGWHIHRRYIDRGVSGRSTQNRKEFNNMMGAIKRDIFDYVVVYKLDRLSRSDRDTLELIDKLNEHNIGLVSITENLDTKSTTGRLVIGILASVNQFESTVIKERVKMGMDKAKEQGRHLGRPPKGYKIDPKTKKLIKEK